MCLQSNLRLTLMSHLTLLLLLNLSLDFRHMIIMIQEKYRLLAHILLVIMLLHLMYSLMMRVLLTSQAQNQILRNRLRSMIHIVILKVQLQILNLPTTVRNMLLLQVQPMIIIKQQLQLMYQLTINLTILHSSPLPQLMYQLRNFLHHKGIILAS